jgi:hypothetical protein
MTVASPFIIRILTGFGAIAHHEIWNNRNLAQHAWGDKGEDHHLAIRNAGY